MGGYAMNQDERMYVVKNQKVTIEGRIEGERILDIGGGGEGVIGICYKDRVVAIDPRKDELEEASDGPLKIVMDARQLSFLDKSFDVVTSFFTLMYIDSTDHEKVFNEIYRVLKRNGKFIIWDSTIEKYDGGVKDIFVIELEINTSNKIIKTGYGVGRRGKHQSIEYFKNLGEKTGFAVKNIDDNDQVFKIVFRKN